MYTLFRQRFYYCILKFLNDLGKAYQCHFHLSFEIKPLCLLFKKPSASADYTNLGFDNS